MMGARPAKSKQRVLLLPRFSALCSGHMGRRLKPTLPELIGAAAGKNFAQNAVGGGVEVQLKFAGGAAGLIHQRRIEEHSGPVNERTGSVAACGLAGVGAEILG